MSSLMSIFGIRVKKPKIAGFQVQTSVYGLPVPIVYGSARISGNLIHMPKQPRLLKSGGKGGKSSAKSGQQNYAAPVALALCEGPIAGIGNVWKDKDTKVDFSVYAAKGWSLFTGTSSQAPWSYLTTNYPAQAIPYQFTAYIAGSDVLMPGSQMSQYSWEVKGFLPFGGGIVDASPADIVEDYLTDPEYGANFPSALLGDMTLMQDYCAAAGLFCSPVFGSQQPGRDQLNDVLEIANTAAVWSDGMLKFIPYGDTPLSGNGHTYTPDTTPLYNLGDNDFLPNSGADLGGDQGPQSNGGDLDPIVMTRTDPATAYNQVPIEYDNRLFDYNNTPYVADDLAAIIAYGPIPMTALSLPAVKTAAVAQQVAQLRLQREQSVRNTYEFNLGWKYSLLEPMDLVTITDPGLGLNHTPVRIISVVEMDSEQGWAITAEDWPFGTATAALYTTGSADGPSPNANVDPGNTNAPVIVESPRELSLSPLDILVGASGGPNWGGCEVWMSVDGTDYWQVGIISGDTPYGTLTASLASGTAWPGTDTTHTLAVDVSGSNGTLDSQSSTAFNALIPLCWVGGEWLAYETATLTSAGHYNLTTLYRGLYNSTIASPAASGTPFIFVGTNMLRVPWPQGASGQTVYFKLPAFNIYGAELQDLASVSAFTYTLGSDPIPFGGGGLPQGTVAINTNGIWNATADGPSSTQSYRWLASTSAFPSDASTIATGTIVNGRTFSIVAGGTLTFGQTIYLTIVPYNYTGAVGTAGASIHIRGSYQSYSSSKSAYFAYSGFGSDDVGGATRAIAVISGQSAVCGYGVGTGVIPQSFAFSQPFTMPNGSVITGITQDLYFSDPQPFSGSYVTNVEYYLYRITGGVQTPIYHGTATNNYPATTWQSLPSGTLSENTAGNTYQVIALITLSKETAGTTYATGAVGGFSVAYNSSLPTVTY